MKLTKFDETLKKSRHAKNEAKQGNGPELDPKKQVSLTQGIHQKEKKGYCFFRIQIISLKCM